MSAEKEAARGARFGFVIHPTSLDHVRNALPVTRAMPRPMLEIVLRSTKPYLIGRARHITSKLGTEVEGYFLVCPLFPHQMMAMDAKPVVDRIVACGHIAERLGAEILGLGGYTSIVGDKGVTVARQLAIPVTSGNSLTAWSAVQAILRGCQAMGKDPARATLAVIGATGSIGSLCSRKLANLVPRITITARRFERLESLKHELSRTADVQVTVETDPHRAAQAADLLILTTSAPDTLLAANELKPGTVVCDISVPRNLAGKEQPRPDVLVIDGGIMRLPGNPVFGVDIGTPDGCAYACMSETILLALERRFESFSLGEHISVERMDEIGRIAQKHGFEVLMPAATAHAG